MGKFASLIRVGYPSRMEKAKSDNRTTEEECLDLWDFLCQCRNQDRGAKKGMILKIRVMAMEALRKTLTRQLKVEFGITVETHDGYKQFVEHGRVIRRVRRDRPDRRTRDFKPGVPGAIRRFLGLGGFGHGRKDRPRR